jgi:ADP-ribosylglycohydrolase
MMNLTESKYVGCLLGGAVGDALGAVTEFMTLAQIQAGFGNTGIHDYHEFETHCGRITDDTQMTLFTAEAMLRAWHRHQERGIGPVFTERCYRSYLLWHRTQTDRYQKGNQESFLMNEPLLFKRRAPGMTCLSALQSGTMGTLEEPLNDSKGCGGVMRAAPVGLVLYKQPEEAFRYGARISAITHGHPSGYLSGGAFSAIIAFLVQGSGLEEAINSTCDLLKSYKDHGETLEAIRSAVQLAETGDPSFEKLETLGGGWVGEEALSISLYCALRYEHDFENAVHLAVNHSGDSDSTGAITGNIVGLINGVESIPKRWTDPLELSELIIRIGEDLYEGVTKDLYSYSPEWTHRYPPN